jgi:phosphate transport system permease protein
MSKQENPLPELLVNRKFRSLFAVRIQEAVIKVALVSCSLFSILITLAIVVILFKEAFTFFGFGKVSLLEFFTGTEWTVRLGSHEQYGVLPLITGTLLVCAVAMIVALPTGLITAVFLSEYAPRRLRTAMKPILEVLAGIPTIVYGFFALTMISPVLKNSFWIFSDMSPTNALSAGIAVGILCLPTVSSLSEDALRAVPGGLREAAYGLGATRFDVSTKVVMPAALSGIVSAFLLAASRAIGETMIVTMAAGQVAKLTADPRDSVMTMTGYIAQTFGGEDDQTELSLVYYSIFAVAATLFVITLILTFIGNVIRNRFKESYE